MQPHDVTYDLFVWSRPRELDDDQAVALIRSWQDAGGDPSQSPFEPSTDVGWFYRELRKDEPGLELSSDAVPNPSTTPVWLSGTDEPPARVVRMRLPLDTPADVVNSIFGLAAKYDLVMFDSRSRRLHLPLEEMAAVTASATFWPGGAIQAAVAGGVGLVIAVVAGWSASR